MTRAGIGGDMVASAWVCDWRNLHLNWIIRLNEWKRSLEKERTILAKVKYRLFSKEGLLLIKRIGFEEP